MKEETKIWLKKARWDFETARYNFEGNRFDVTVFYAQQAAEKALKAMQIEKTNRFDKIHDLVELAKSVGADNFILKLCDKISPAYFVSRYPDIENKYDRKEVKEILEAGRGVLEWIEKRLK